MKKLKRLKKLIAVLFAIALFCLNTSAQDASTVTNTHFAAIRKGTLKLYPIGKRFLIKYTDESSTNKIRGILTEVNETEIFVKINRKHDRPISIEIDEITLVRKINPKRKIIWGMVGTAMVAGGAAIAESQGNSQKEMSGGLMGYPIAGMGAYIVAAIPVALLIEKLNERRSSKGWKFQSIKP
jgi:hypothetical protein